MYFRRLTAGTISYLARTTKKNVSGHIQNAQYSARVVRPDLAWRRILLGQVFRNQYLPDSTTCLQSVVQLRRLSGAHDVSGEYIRTEVDAINRDFAEAREEIELALESKETVYFNEEVETAREAVEKVIEKFENLKSRLSDVEKGQLQRSMGLKMEQLKGELHGLQED